FQDQLRVYPHVEPAHSPVQVRAGRTTGRTHCGHHLALFHAVARFHVDARQVQEIAADAVAVVDQQGAAGEVEVWLGKGHDARGRRLDRRAAGGRDVHPRMRRAGLAVVDPRASETPADATFDGADEGRGEIGARIVAQPCL